MSDENKPTETAPVEPISATLPSHVLVQDYDEDGNMIGEPYTMPLGGGPYLVVTGKSE